MRNALDERADSVLTTKKCYVLSKVVKNENDEDELQDIVIDGACIRTPDEDIKWEVEQEELKELQAEVEKASQKTIEDEFGDVLFSMINYARFLNINPDTALERTNQKFSKRFTYLETKAKELGKSLQDMTLTEMDVYWEEAKKQ